LYLRHTIRRKGGREHTYWQLVRAVRRGGKVVQEVVAQLGELNAQARGQARLLAAQITGGAMQGQLFEPLPQWHTPVAVRTDQVRVERARSFGAVWLGWMLWRSLGLDRLCEGLLGRGREEVPWAVMAAVLVVARLCEPSSELHIAEDWYRHTALEDLIGLPARQVNDDRLYRALDRLLPHKGALEQHLRGRLGELFGLDYDLLLYDVTSTYFEGDAAANPLAKRGYSRDHRSDCKQVNIALVVTREGMPLGYELFAGNRADVTTVKEIVESMERRYGLASRIWVMDRGMASAENLRWLKASGRRYLIGTTRAVLRQFIPELTAAAGWQSVGEAVEAKLVAGADGEDSYLLCRSTQRRAKEQAMHQRFAERIDQGLARLAERIARSKGPLQRSKLDRQIGRLLGANRHAAGRYLVELVEDPSCAAGLKLTVSINQQWEQRAALAEGCYVLRTNLTQWDPHTLWRTYIQLTQAEAAFRIHKRELSIRPIWHQKQSRVEAHILVCFLAYVLWKTLEQWQARAGLGNSPRTILDELGCIQSTDVVLPLAEEPGRELRIRCVVRPEPAQAALLDRLGLILPKRLHDLPPDLKM
jgi:Transposase DDE domain